MPPTRKITPCLWFHEHAEEALAYYLSVFERDASMIDQTFWGEGGMLPKGALLTAHLRIHDQEIMLLNGGPPRAFTEAFSLHVGCESQEEIDRLWERLTADGGEPSHCGWLKDRFGLSWQIVPRELGTWLTDPDPVRAQRVMSAMLPMRKLDLAMLRAAHEA